MQIQRYLNATTNRGIEVNRVVASVSLVSYITSLPTNPIVALYAGTYDLNWLYI